MTTRIQRVWNGTAWEDLAAPVGVAPVSYQATEPTSPQTGDIWVDSSTNISTTGLPVSYQATAPVNPSIGDIWIESDLDVPSVGQNLSYRWRKIAAGGETTLSGNDASGLPLDYTPNYEQVYLNGMLLYRDADYTATTGTTISISPALSAGDVIEVLAIKAEPLADTYTQAQSDSKYQTQVGYQVLAWGSIKSNVVPPIVRSSFNVSSFTRNSIGNYTVSFSNSVANANYSVIVTTDGGTDVQRYAGVGFDTETTTGFSIFSGYQGSTGSIVSADVGRINFIVMGTK